MNYSVCSGGKAQRVLGAARASGHRCNPSLQPAQALAPYGLNSLIYIPLFQTSAPAMLRMKIMSNESQFKIKSHPGIRLNLPNSFHLGCQPDLKFLASPNVYCINCLHPSLRDN